MTLLKRLENIGIKIKLNKYQKIPDWNKFIDDFQYKIAYQNSFHFRNNIESFQDSKKIYDDYLKWNLVSKEQYDLFINAESEFWNQAELSKSEVFFMGGN